MRLASILLSRADWESNLASLIERAAQRWSLTLTDDITPSDGHCSWVSAALLPDGGEAVLKLSWPHYEAEQEALALRLWDGGPAARLIAEHPVDWALLMERVSPGHPLNRDQDKIVGELLKELRTFPVDSAVRPLSEMIEHWTEEPKTLLEVHGYECFRELIDTTTEVALLHTDLHVGNILAGTRRPWIIIDPKPFVGDPAYDLTQHIFNNFDRLEEQPQETIENMADLAGLDPQRVLRWTFARAATTSGNDTRYQRLARELKGAT